jgi:hypothetical protein
MAKKQKTRNQQDFEVLNAFGGLLAEEEGFELSIQLAHYQCFCFKARK